MGQALLPLNLKKHKEFIPCITGSIDGPKEIVEATELWYKVDGEVLHLSNKDLGGYTQNEDYEGWNWGGGFSEATNFTRVIIENEIVPLSTYDWFNSFDKLTEIENIDKLNTSKVTNMSCMFYNCSSLENLDVSGFDTISVTNMHSMFDGCEKLTNLDVSGFDTRNVTDMTSMFWNCAGLTSLDVTRFDTSNVNNMNSMFIYCSGLTSLDVSDFDTSNVTNMYMMFRECTGLTELDLTNFNTKKIGESIYDKMGMFRNVTCTVYVGFDWTLTPADTEYTANGGIFADK